MTGTLTPEGARLLRAARDQILADPESFSMGVWECGTRACIAGHVARVMKQPIVGDPLHPWKASDYVRRVVTALGFGAESTEDWWVGPSLAPLFCNLGHHDTPALARDAINAFLWSYGYPAEEIAPTNESVSASPSAVESVASR